MVCIPLVTDPKHKVFDIWLDSSQNHLPDSLNDIKPKEPHLFINFFFVHMVVKNFFFLSFYQ